MLFRVETWDKVHRRYAVWYESPCQVQAQRIFDKPYGRQLTRRLIAVKEVKIVLAKKRGE